jgi:hypothetical protein
VSPTTASQSSIRIDDIELATLPAASTRLFELTETLQPLAYRVVVHDIRPEFDRAVVLGGIAALFRRGDEESVDLNASMPLTRTVRDAQAAARLTDLLTATGCRCAIEIDIAAPLPQAVAAPAWRSAMTSWRDRVFARMTAVFHSTRAHIDSVAATGDLIIQSIWHGSIARCAKLRANAMQPIALAIGLLGFVGVLVVTLPGTSAPVYATRAGDATLIASVDPRPPAVELSSRATAASTRRAPANDALHRAKTPLGELTLEKNPNKAGHWYLKWNGAIIRDLRVESPPSIVPRQGRGKPEPAIGEFGDEVALVIDTGEPRSTFCQANKSLLVVLSRLGAAHMHDIPGNCAELETVAVDRERMLLHFYDQAAPSVAYQGGQILRTLE